MSTEQNAALPDSRTNQALSDTSANTNGDKAIMTTETKLAPGWTAAILEVSKTEKQGEVSKRVAVGKAKYFIPTLSAIAQICLDAKIIPKELEKGEEDDGVPLYDHDVANWVMQAIVGKVQVKVRNSLVPESAEFQSDKQPATSFEELLSPAERTGEAMKRKSEFVTGFSGHIAGLGKSAQVVATWKNLIRTPEALMSQSPTIKAKGLEYLDSFMQSLSAENLERYGKFIVAFGDAAKGTGVTDSEM